METDKAMKMVLLGGAMSKCGAAARLVGSSNVHEDVARIDLDIQKKLVQTERGPF